MSHYYYLSCECGENMDGGFNHAQEALVDAVKTSHLLMLLSQSNWDPSLCEYNGYMRGIASFILSHWDHGGFIVNGEYQSDEPIKVKPDIPKC